MHFSTIEQILAKIQQQPGWEQYQQYCQILDCWRRTVPKTTEKHTRPLYLKRQVLWVAVSSSARAQELSFQRYYLLKKLNTQLPFFVKDIRFSTSEWKQVIEPKLNSNCAHIVKKNYKTSTIINQKKNIESSPVFNSKILDSDAAIANDPQAAVRRWIEKIKARSDSFNYCPQCASLTPESELKRWNSCHHCVAEKWSQEYHLPKERDRD